MNPHLTPHTAPNGGYRAGTRRSARRSCLSGIVPAVAAWLAARREERHVRRTMRELERLPPWLLADIGICHPSQIEAMARNARANRRKSVGEDATLACKVAGTAGRAPFVAAGSIQARS